MTFDSWELERKASQCAWKSEEAIQLRLFRDRDYSGPQPLAMPFSISAE